MAIFACINPCLNGSTWIFSRWARLAGASFLRTHWMPKFCKCLASYGLMKQKYFYRVHNFSVFERCKIILYNSTYLKSNRHVWCVDVHATDPFLAHAIFSDQLMGMTSVRFFFFHAWNNNHCWAPMKKFWNVKNIDWAKWFEGLKRRD